MLLSIQYRFWDQSQYRYLSTFSLISWPLFYLFSISYLISHKNILSPGGSLTFSTSINIWHHIGNPTEIFSLVFVYIYSSKKNWILFSVKFRGWTGRNPSRELQNPVSTIWAISFQEIHEPPFPPNRCTNPSRGKCLKPLRDGRIFISHQF